MAAPAKNRRMITALVIASAVLSPFFFFSSKIRPWSTGHWFPQIAQEITYPLEYSWRVATGWVSDMGSHYVFLRHAALENDALKRELTELKLRTMNHDEQGHEIERLRKLFSFSEIHKDKYIPAQVVGSPMLAPFESLRISKGSSDNVRVGMPVVSADGVVGRIIRVTPHFSDVQLLVDANFNLDVILQRTRVRGVLRGMTRDYCRLGLPRQAEIRIGDTIVTTGIVGGFPKGLAVGRVMRISFEADNVSQLITVEPWVDYRRLEEVIVVDHPDRDLDKIVEIAGPEWLDNPVRSTGGG